MWVQRALVECVLQSFVYMTHVSSKMTEKNVLTGVVEDLFIGDSFYSGRGLSVTVRWYYNDIIPTQTWKHSVFSQVNAILRHGYEFCHPALTLTIILEQPSGNHLWSRSVICKVSTSEHRKGECINVQENQIHKLWHLWDTDIALTP